MATLREYYDADFSYAARMHVLLNAPNNLKVEAAVLYDFSALSAFLICYIPGADHTVEFFRDTVFNYPTFAEAYKVAALNGLNKL